MKRLIVFKFLALGFHAGTAWAQPADPAASELVAEPVPLPSAPSSEPETEATPSAEIGEPTRLPATPSAIESNQPLAARALEPPPVPASEAPEAPSVKLTGAPGKGFTIDAGEAFSLNLKTRVLLRYQLNIPPEDSAGERYLTQTVSVGTLRLSLSGHVYQPKFTYLLQLAFGARDYRDGAVSPILDAYLDWAAHRDLSARVGQYFVPFDRLRTVRDPALQLADRARPVSELTLDRDVGVMFYSNSFLGNASPVAWRLGAFGGGGTNLVQGKEPGALLVARLELRPFGPLDDDSDGDLERRARPGLALGAGLAHNWNTDRVRSTTGAMLAGGTTDYLHAALDMVFKWQGFALQAEHLWKDASRDSISSTDELGEPVTEYTRSGRGWVLQASYVFDPPLEFVARLSRLYASGTTDPVFVKESDARAHEVAAGLNYYVNGHRLKLQADVISRMSRDFELEKADHVGHLQLDATF